jgi:hypothetical protein
MQPREIRRSLCSMAGDQHRIAHLICRDQLFLGKKTCTVTRYQPAPILLIRARAALIE